MRPTDNQSPTDGDENERIIYVAGRRFPPPPVLPPLVPPVRHFDPPLRFIGGTLLLVVGFRLRWFVKIRVQRHGGT